MQVTCGGAPARGPTRPAEQPCEWWHGPTLARVVAEFSSPGGQVSLLGWPPVATNSHDGAAHDWIARVVVDDLGRHLSDDRVGSTGVPVDGHAPTSTTPAADLVVLGIDAAEHNTRSRPLADHVVDRLAAGGSVVVLTAHTTRGGELVDPTGAVVREAKGLGWTYLQHIVVLTVPLGDGELVIRPALDSPPHSLAGDRHRAVHRDLLVFHRPAPGPARATPSAPSLARPDQRYLGTPAR